MSAEKQTLRRGTKKQLAGFISCLLLFLLCSGLVFAAEQADKTAPQRYRVFSLKHITAEQGKAYLTQLGIGTVSQLPSPNTLLVTASASELIKAGTILELVDAEQQYVIKPIFAASKADNLPSSEKIASEVGSISVGTFSELPAKGPKPRVIIDTHNDAVIAIAPAEELEKIIAAIGRIQDEETTALQPAEPQETSDSDKLLDELVEIEKIAAEPNEGGAVVDVPEPNEPTTAVATPQPEEPAEEAQPQAIAEPQAEEQAIETEEEEAEAEEMADEMAIQKRSYEPRPIPIGEEELTLDLPEKLNIIDLLDLVGKYLKLDYMYDPAKVKGEVTLKLQGPVKVRELYPLAESALKFRNFVMTRKGNLVTIVPSGEVLDIDPTLMYDEKGKVEYGDVIVTRLFDLQYIDTDSAKNLLSQMKLGANITDIKDTGTLIVTDYTYRMGRIEELLQIIDRPGEPKHFRFRQLKYTMAKTLAPKVKTLVEQLGTMSVMIAQGEAPTITRRRGESSAAFRRRQAAAERAAAAKPTPAKPTVYLDADERTNRILMIGFENELDVVDELIDTLDVEQQDLRTLRVYDIQHVDAQEVRNKLQELGIIGGGQRVPSARTAPSKAAPSAPTEVSEGLVEEPQVVIIESTNSLLVNATAEQHIQIATIIGYVDSATLEEAIPYEIYPLENQNPVDLANVLEQLIQETIKDKEGKIQQVVKKEEDIEIVADENTFSIIVYASKKNQEWIRKLIKTLDKRRPQVLIDVTLVEISRTDTFQYDLDLVSSIPDLDYTSGLVDLASISTSAILSKLDSTTDRNKFQDFSSSSGTGKGFYGDHHVQALLTLMQAKNYGRVLAKPKVLVNDNETGTITTDKTIYVARSAKTTAAETGTQVTTAYTFDSFVSGISLNITPHISEGDLLRLEIEMSRSTQESPDASAENAPPPDKTENKINTIVTVPDDSTIILGGVLTLDQSKDGGKVPFFGDIPIIGGLFRNIDNSDTESKLYIFVKANILRPSETERGLPDLTRISKRNRVAFEKSESKFQEYEQWPGVESDPMDPLRVLEAE